MLMSRLDLVRERARALSLSAGGKIARVGRDASGVLGAVPTALVAAGAVLLIYVGAQYGTMYHQQRDLARRWQEEQAIQQSGPQKASLHATDSGLIRLSIPKIDLDDIVVEGTSHKQLLIGPGHMVETAMPGQNGNSVITGHRDTFFRHIYELDKGDIILVRRKGEVYRYEVTGKRVVQPDDISVIHPTSDARLTLITCYPTYFIGPAPERLVVFSKLVDHAPDSQAATGPGLN